MKTRTDLVNKTLDNLGVSAVGQTADPESYAAVDGVVGPIVESLAAREIASVPDLSQIPDSIFLDVALLVANACKLDFGLAADEFDRVTKAAVGDPSTGDIGAEARLREVYRGKPTFERQQAEYF